MDTLPPPDPPTTAGSSPLRHALAVLFWLLFGVSQYRGCENAGRLERMEADLKAVKAKLEQRPAAPAPPAPR